MYVGVKYMYAAITALFILPDLLHHFVPKKGVTHNH